MERKILSGSSGGQPIKVTATASPGTMVHTVNTNRVRATLFAVNTDSTDRLLTIQFGGTTEPDNSIEVTVPAVGGPIEVISGQPLAQGKSIRAFAATGNVVLVYGFWEVQE